MVSIRMIIILINWIGDSGLLQVRRSIARWSSDPQRFGEGSVARRVEGQHVRRCPWYDGSHATADDPVEDFGANTARNEDEAFSSEISELQPTTICKALIAQQDNLEPIGSVILQL